MTTIGNHFNLEYQNSSDNLREYYLAQNWKPLSYKLPLDETCYTTENFLVRSTLRHIFLPIRKVLESISQSTMVESVGDQIRHEKHTTNKDRLDLDSDNDNGPGDSKGEDEELEVKEVENTDVIIDGIVEYHNLNCNEDFLEDYFRIYNHLNENITADSSCMHHTVGKANENRKTHAENIDIVCKNDIGNNGISEVTIHSNHDALRNHKSSEEEKLINLNPRGEIYYNLPEKTAYLTSSTDNLKPNCSINQEIFYNVKNSNKSVSIKIEDTSHTPEKNGTVNLPDHAIVNVINEITHKHDVKYHQSLGEVKRLIPCCTQNTKYLLDSQYNSLINGHHQQYETNDSFSYAHRTQPSNNIQIFTLSVESTAFDTSLGQKLKNSLELLYGNNLWSENVFNELLLHERHSDVNELPSCTSSPNSDISNSFSKI